MRSRTTAGNEKQVGSAGAGPLAAPRSPQAQNSTPPHNLPARGTSFVGRDEQIVQLQEQLAHTRLLTLVGAGGSGKTRLAVELVTSVLDRFPDGAFLVELAGLTDPALVPQAIATALGVREEPARPLIETLADALGPKRLLLVLDNCEHLREACAGAVFSLLRACPSLVVLPTSREALHLEAEVAWPVPTLDLPPDDPPPSLEALGQCAAVRLFLDRSRSVAPQFALTEDNAPAVAAICRRLDGLPLAIELAAAKMAVMSAQDLLARLPGRFELLASDDPTTAPRHRTLQHLIEWSYALLAPAEQQLFADLAVFAGGFALDAVEAVCGASAIGPLMRLVACSLVEAQADAGGVRRYRLLETLRDFALQHLDQGEDGVRLRGRHLLWCITLAERAEAAAMSPDERAWFDRLSDEHENLRAALSWSLLQHPDALVETAGIDGGHAQPARARDLGRWLAASLGRFWYLRAHRREGMAWLEAALLPFVPPADASQVNALEVVEPTPAYAKALFHLGMLAGQGDLRDSYANLRGAHALLRQSLAMFRRLDDRRGCVQVLTHLAGQTRHLGQPEEARTLIEEALHLARELADTRLTISALIAMAYPVWFYDDDTRQRLASEALSLSRELGFTLGEAMACRILGDIAKRRGDYSQASAWLLEDLARTRQFNEPGGIALALHRLGEVSLEQRLYRQAEEQLSESLALYRQLGHKTRMAQLLEKLGRVALARRKMRLAHARFTESLELFLQSSDSDAAQLARDGLALTQDAARAAGIAIPSDPGAPPPSPSSAGEPLRRPGRPRRGRRVHGAASSDAVARLSEREIEVARLVAEGLTNQAIAGKLHVSKRTVVSHVEHIFRKLGIRSRMQLGRWATEHGLGAAGEPPRP